MSPESDRCCCSVPVRASQPTEERGASPLRSVPPIRRQSSRTPRAPVLMSLRSAPLRAGRQQTERSRDAPTSAVRAAHAHFLLGFFTIRVVAVSSPNVMGACAISMSGPWEHLFHTMTLFLSNRAKTQQQHLTCFTFLV